VKGNKTPLHTSELGLSDGCAVLGFEGVLLGAAKLRLPMSLDSVGLNVGSVANPGTSLPHRAVSICLVYDPLDEYECFRMGRLCLLMDSAPLLGLVNHPTPRGSCGLSLSVG
jgi:hypothetical protein